MFYGPGSLKINFFRKGGVAVNNPSDKPKVLVAAGADYFDKLPKGLHPQQLPEALGEFQIITARTVEEALAHFQSNPDISAVVTTPHIDDQLYRPHAMELIRHLLKAGFKGPIILVSYCQNYQRIFLEEGCTHAVGKEKVTDVLREAIGLFKH